MVAPAFGDVQVTCVFDGRDDRGADGGQVGGPAAGPASRGIFAESDIPDMVVRLDRYYSHCFSVCDRAAAQRGAWFPASWLHGVTFFRPVKVSRPWPGCGCCSGASGRGPGGACASVTSGGGRRGGRGTAARRRSPRCRWRCGGFRRRTAGPGGCRPGRAARRRRAAARRRGERPGQCRRRRGGRGWRGCCLVNTNVGGGLGDWWRAR